MTILGKSGGPILRILRRSAPFILFDALVVIVAFYLALPMRFAGAPPAHYSAALLRLVPWIVAAYTVANCLWGLYSRMWCYASAHEAISIAASATLATLLITALNVLGPWEQPLPVSMVLLGGFFSMAGFAAIRYRQRLITGSLRRWRKLWKVGEQSLPHCQSVLIVGAGEAGQLLAWRFLNQTEGEGYHVVGFVDDDPAKHGMRIHGLSVLGDRGCIPKVVTSRKVDIIVIAAYNISGPDFRGILDCCERSSAAIKVLPNILEWIGGKDSRPPIRDVSAEDLLGRKPVEIDREACRALLSGKRVLVTGAAGSIGSELCRQVLTFSPAELLMLDNNESGLYDLALELRAHFPGGPFRSLIADVTDRAKMHALFQTRPPQVVFHAAAYKHVPLMEEHPDEAVRVNVLGTRALVELAARYGAERFVFISTDKAVNPSCVMGASKRMGELLVTLANQNGNVPNAAPGDDGTPASAPHTIFTVVRFGNVLGSRGSVVPTFEQQIKMGGPITITHPEMTRYFMSISEAVSLVIQTAVLTQGGDIFVLDMGQQIRIEDLARRLIRLRGLRPDVDIPIAYCGIRPGEKMQEELVGQGERTTPTCHPKIFCIDPGTMPEQDSLDQWLAVMEKLIEQQQPREVADLLLHIVALPPASSGFQSCPLPAQQAPLVDSRVQGGHDRNALKGPGL